MLIIQREGDSKLSFTDRKREAPHSEGVNPSYSGRTIAGFPSVAAEADSAGVDRFGLAYCVEESGFTALRFHDPRHTWASWHRQSGTSCDELEELGGWKTRSMADRYAKFDTERLAAAARGSGPAGKETWY